MDKTRNLFVLLAAWSLLVGILAGCGAKKESPAAGAPAAATAAAKASPQPARGVEVR